MAKQHPIYEHLERDRHRHPDRAVPAEVNNDPIPPPAIPTIA